MPRLTINEMWLAFWSNAPDGTPEAMRVHMRRAYYAGMFIMFATCLENAEEMEEEAVHAYLNGLYSEMEQFKDAVKRGEA